MLRRSLSAEACSGFFFALDFSYLYDLRLRLFYEYHDLTKKKQDSILLCAHDNDLYFSFIGWYVNYIPAPRHHLSPVLAV